MLLKLGYMKILASDAGAKVPGIFDGDIFTAIFTLALFVTLVAVLGKYAWGPILDSLKSREEHIRSTIENAERAQAKAEKKLVTYGKRLDRAQAEANELVEQGRAEAAAVIVEMKEQCQAENQKVREESRKDIARAQKRALRDMHIVVTELATDLAGRIISKNIDAAGHDKLLDESLEALGVERD